VATFEGDADTEWWSHISCRSVTYESEGSTCYDGWIIDLTEGHKRMAWGGHGLPKVSCGPAMPNPSTPCGRATSETASWLFQGWPACRAGGLRPSSTPLDTPRRTPMTEGESNVSEFSDMSSGLTSVPMKLTHKDRGWTDESTLVAG
jgi:hypothetical protein